MRFIFFVCAAFLFSKAAAGSDYIKVVDGDSLFIGKREIRLSGIDAPEYHQECYDENDAPYPCGKEAFWALKKMAGKNIVCKKVTVDRYRREVADCFCGKKNINKEMVRQGYAVAYDRYTQNYVPAQNEAKKHKRGIWRGRFMKPELYRRLLKD